MTFGHSPQEKEKARAFRSSVRSVANRIGATAVEWLGCKAMPHVTSLRGTVPGRWALVHAGAAEVEQEGLGCDTASCWNSGCLVGHWIITPTRPWKLYNRPSAAALQWGSWSGTRLLASGPKVTDKCVTLGKLLDFSESWTPASPLAFGPLPSEQSLFGFKI